MRVKIVLLLEVLLISTTNFASSHPFEQDGDQRGTTESGAESTHENPAFNEIFSNGGLIGNHLHKSVLNTTREEQNSSGEVSRDEAPGQAVPASVNVTAWQSVSEGTSSTSERPLDASSEQQTSQDASHGEIASSNATTIQPVSHGPGTTKSQLSPNETSDTEQQSSPNGTSTNEPQSSPDEISTERQSSPNGTSTTEPQESRNETSTEPQSSTHPVSPDHPSTPTTHSTTTPQTSPDAASTTAPESSPNPHTTEKPTTIENGTQASVTRKCTPSVASPATHALSNFGPGFAVGMLTTALLFATFYGIRWLYNRNKKRRSLPIPVVKSSLHELRSNAEYF